MNFDKFFDFIVNNEIRFTAKLKLFTLIVISILCIDYFFRFSDSYITSTKIKQIEQIESLILKDSIRSETKQELIRIEKSVINRQDFWDSLSSLASLIQRRIISTSPNNNTNTDTNPIVRSVFWHYATSGSLLWVFIILSPIALLGKNTNFSTILLGMVLVDIVFASTAFILAYIFAFIPTFEYPIINYILNLIGSSLIFWFFYRVLIRAGSTATN